jgi:hypothetical protein
MLSVMTGCIDIKMEANTGVEHRTATLLVPDMDVCIKQQKYDHEHSTDTQG